MRIINLGSRCISAKQISDILYNLILKFTRIIETNLKNIKVLNVRLYHSIYIQGLSGIDNQ